MRFYAIGGTREPVEVVLDYYHEETGVAGMARTYWHPAEDVVGHAQSPQLVDQADALALMTRARGRQLAEDEMYSLIHRVQSQVALAKYERP